MTGKIWVNIIKQDVNVMVTACDDELLGKTIENLSRKILISEGFYGGTLMGLEEAIRLIKKASSANLLGANVVNAAVNEGLIHPEAVTKIADVLHALFIKF